MHRLPQAVKTIMKKSQAVHIGLNIETVPVGFVPTQAQIDALAKRLMPEIKRYFADDKIQEEFQKWQEKALHSTQELC